MGRGFVAYQWPDSGREEWVLWSAFIHYRLPDGSQLDILQQPAWCPACGHFVIAEEVPSSEALEEELVRYRSADPDTLQRGAFVSNGKPVEVRIRDLLRYLAWRGQRRSPARCLDCGRPEVIPVPMSGEFAHPGTGERVVVGDRGFTAAAPWVAEFSPEGERLTPPRGTGTRLATDNA